MLGVLNPLPDLLLSLFYGNSVDSNNILQIIRKYNNACQMIFFETDIIHHDQYMLTFKIQGKIYSHVELLLPVPDAEHKFLQIIFMDKYTC